MVYSYEKYIDELQGKYLDDLKKIDKIIKKSSLSGDEIEDAMYKIIDLFIKGQNEKIPVSKITGGNIKRFCSSYTYDFKLETNKDYKVILGGFLRLVLLLVSMIIISFVNLDKGIIKSAWSGEYDTGYIASFIIISICTSFIISIIIKALKVKDHDNQALKLKKFDFIISSLVGIIAVILKATFKISTNISLDGIALFEFFAVISLLIIEQILFDICIYSDSEMVIRMNIKMIKDRFKKRNSKGSTKMSMDDYLKSYSSNRALKYYFIVGGETAVIAAVIILMICDISLVFYLGCIIPQFLSMGSTENNTTGFIGYMFNYKYEGQAIEEIRKQGSMMMNSKL